VLLHYIDNTVMALYCPNMFAYTRITLEFFSKVFIVRQYHEKMIVIYGFFFFIFTVSRSFISLLHNYFCLQ
jgi:hypothetical protein